MVTMCKRVKEFLKLSVTTEQQFFLLDKKLLQHCGFWPVESLINFRLIGVISMNFLLNVSPKSNLMVKSFISKDFKTFTAVVPELLMNYCIFFMAFSLILTKKLLSTVYLRIEKKWKSSKVNFKGKGITYSYIIF